MTTNEPTVDPESIVNPLGTPADEQVEDNVDEEKTADDVELLEPQEEEDDEELPQQVKDRTATLPEKEERAPRFPDPNAAVIIDKDEPDVGRLTMEKDDINTQQEKRENSGDVQKSETQSANLTGNLEPGEDRERLLDDPSERHDTSSAPTNSKEAVQDPSVIDSSPSETDNGVIDVDTFDDDVSDEEEPDPSPAADEITVEHEDANEPSSDETNSRVVHDIQDEPIDLTTSPSRQPTKAPTFRDSDERVNIEGRTVAERSEAIGGEGVIDVDEPEEHAEEPVAIDAAKRRSTAEDLKASSVEDDENHGKGAILAENVSAGLDVDLKRGVLSPGKAPVESNALETTPDGEIESHSLLNRARVAKQNEEEPISNEARIGSEDGGLYELVDEGTSKTDGGIELIDAGARKPGADESEPPMSQDESEDEELEDDGAGRRDQQEHEGIEAEEHGEALTARLEVTGSEKELHEKTSSVEQKEVLMEDIRAKESHPQEASNRFVADVQDKEATSKTEQTQERIGRPSGDDLSLSDSMNVDHVAPTTFDGSSEAVENKERGKSDAPGTKESISKEKTTAKTVVPDISVSRTSRTGVIPDLVSSERNVSKEFRSVAQLSDPQLPGDENMEESKMDILTRPLELDNKTRSASDSTNAPVVEAGFKPSAREDQNASGSDKEADRSNEVVPVHHRGDSAASEGVKQPREGNLRPSVEQSKSANTGHLAPMFGIQISRPIKKGHISFASPPSFPRYSLNPQAVPFLPAKLRTTERPEEQTDASVTPSTVVSTPSNEKKVSDTEALRIAGEKDEKARVVVGHDLTSSRMATAPTAFPNAKSSDKTGKPDLSADNAPLTDALPESAADASTRSVLEVGVATATMASMKRPVQKKVTFAPTPIKSEKALSESEKERTFVESSLASTEAIEADAQDRRKKVLAVAPAPPNSKAERQVPTKPDKAPVEADAVKEKQRVIQVRTDEGLRREVTNVTVAMRQGNSKVRPERKRFTVRLTTGTDEKAKLQFFKASGSSLKLYASLDSSKDNLRVRKVTNRQYVMSVAKMAPPGDDTSDNIVKYFLHFDERDTFEEMHSQCVANLQKQPTALMKKPEEKTKNSKAVIEGLKEGSNPLTPRSGGVKRSAESTNAAQVSKKSKLLADKKKLLDKMAALRRKKEQKGTSVTKESQTQPLPEAFHGGTSGSDKSALKTEDVQAKRKNEGKASNSIQETVPTGQSVPPPKKRTAEVLSNENASKKPRLPISHPKGDVTGIARAPPSHGPSVIPKLSPTSVYSSRKHETRELSTDGRVSHAEAEANPLKVDTELSQKNSGEVPGGKEESGGLTSDELNSKERKAFEKVTRDLKQSENEKNSLQVELEARNRLLRVEREKFLRVQQESSEAWQRVVRTVEALDADIGRLRREDTDRSVESLTRCEISSSEDFFDRLHSFRPSTWAAFENSEIGALECALKGWYNSGPGRIRSSEGSEIRLSECFDNPTFRQGEVERVRSLLREGHCLLSGWIGQSCPDSFRTLEGSQRSFSKDQLKAHCEGLRKGLEGSDTRFEWGASALLLSDDVYEKLAVYNWCLDGECLRCSWCNRRAVVEGESRFDAKSKHYTFCPFRAEDWKMSVLHNAKTLGIEGGGDVLMKDQTSAG